MPIIKDENVQKDSATSEKIHQQNSFDSFFTTFVSEVTELNLLEKDNDAIYKAFMKIVQELNKLNEKLIREENGFDALQVFFLSEKWKI